MNKGSNNHIKDGLYTPEGLAYIFNKGFLHNCYIDANIEDWSGISDKTNFNEEDLKDKNLSQGTKFPQEAEVTPRSMAIIHKKYDWLRWQKYELVNRTTYVQEGGPGAGAVRLIHRRQQTSPKGLYLTKDEQLPKNINTQIDEDTPWNNIDISADIITSIESNCKSYLSNMGIKWNPDLEKNLKLRKTSHVQKDNECQAIFLFIWVVGTIGNIMPIPEGTNPGGRSSDNKNVDNWNYKIKQRLGWIEKYANGKNTNKLIINTLKKDVVELLYNRKIELIYYKWFDSLSQNITSNLYCNMMFMQDYFINCDCKIESIKDNIYPVNNEWYLRNMKLIIERGYRIWYSGSGDSGISFNDSRPFSQIEKEDKENPDAIRVRQVIGSLIYIVKYIAEKKDNNVFKNPEKYLDECLKNYEIKNPGEYLNENKLKLV